MHKFSINPYKPRPVNYWGIKNNNDWKIKTYLINFPSADTEIPWDKLMGELPQPAINENRYGIGFLIIHKGVEANWFLLNWWGEQDIVHQKLFSSPVDDFFNISTPKDNTLMACVYELEIYNFECLAWKENVLGLNGYSFDNYLGEIFSKN